jgi:hypothetical protein
MRSILMPAAAVVVASVALGGCSLLGSDSSKPSRDPSGVVTESSDSDVFAIKVGDCLNSAALSGEVSEVPVVPCDQPHDSEVYDSKTLDAASWPGDDAISTEADAFCTPSFEAFVGMSFDESSLDLAPLTPTEESWKQGDHEILCVISDSAGGLTGSLKGAAR